MAAAGGFGYQGQGAPGRSVIASPSGIVANHWSGFAAVAELMKMAVALDVRKVISKLGGLYMHFA